MCMHVHYYVLTSIVLQMGCKKGKSWSSTFGLHFASLGHKEFKIGLQSFTTKNISDKLRRIKELLGVFGPKLLGAP